MSDSTNLSEYELQLALALSLSEESLKSSVEAQSVSAKAQTASNESPDPDVLETVEKLNRENNEYIQANGDTCIIDAGASYSLTANLQATQRSYFTNKCAILSVWVALMIQASLGLCSVKTPFVGARTFTNPHELYLYFVQVLAKCAQFPRDVYGTDDRFSRDWIGLIANIIGQNVYLWDIESQSCLKFYPRDSTGTEFNGVDAPDLETIDPTRRIILVHVPGHIMVVAATFVVFGVTCTDGSTVRTDVNVLPTVEQLYSRCNKVLEGLSNPIKTPVGTVSVPTIGPIHNLSVWSEGAGPSRSFVEFPNGVKEPHCPKPANDDFEAALAFHYQLNGDAPVV